MKLSNLSVQITLGFFVLAVLWFFNINAVDLLKPDEGRYAEISREMARTGDFVTPRLNGIKYFEKPPLQYWMTALSLKFFGLHNWSARLWSSLCGFLTLLAVFLFSRRFYGLERAVLATAALTGSLLFYVIGHINTLDMGLSFFLTLIALSLSVLLSRDQTSKEYFWANFIFWLSLALGFLSKGLVAVVLPGFAGVLFILVRREWAVFKRVRWVSGILLFLAVTTPWIYLVAQRNPEFMRFFFIHEHFERYLTKVHEREGPVWYFLPFLLAGFFPWNVFLARLPIRRLDSKNLFFAIWCLSIFAFFSFSSSKLVPYVLPIWPLMAILFATSISEKGKPRDAFYVGLGYAAMGVIFFVGSFYVATMTSKRFAPEMYQEFAYYLRAVGVFLTLSILFISGRKWSRTQKISSFALIGLLCMQILFYGYKAFTPSVSSRLVADAIKPHILPETEVYTVHYYEQELPYYLDRLVTLVEFKGELEFGLSVEDVGRFTTFSQFIENWKKTKDLVAVMAPATENLLKPYDFKYKVLYQDRRRMAIVKIKE